jgi:hypothetical protein
LKLEIQPRDDHQVKINVEFEPSVFEEFIRRAARKIARKPAFLDFALVRLPWMSSAAWLVMKPFINRLLKI